MTDLDWINTYSSLGVRLFDLPSFLICILFIAFAGYKYKVPNNYLLVLLLHCFLPFVLNGVLFDPHYMPDQFKYWKGVNAIRNGELGFIEALFGTGNVLEASALLSLLPFPRPTSVISLGFYNTFLYIVLFFVLYNKKFFTRVSIWFYLLFPSAALYSALSLRETLIFFFMTLTIVYARESKPLQSAICLIPLYLIKFQNFFILVPIVLLYFMLKVSKEGLSLSKSLIIGFVGLFILLSSAPLAIPLLNKSRVDMYVEDGGNSYEIELISGIGDFIVQGLTSGIYFLSKPMIWEANGLLPLIQSFENAVILVILLLITKQAWKKAPDRLAFWLLFLAFSMSIYGLVVFNYGTAVRYRYPFVIIYVLFVCADCNIQELLPKRKKITSKYVSY